jgi:hypothetical protein
MVFMKVIQGLLIFAVALSASAASSKSEWLDAVGLVSQTMGVSLTIYDEMLVEACGFELTLEGIKYAAKTDRMFEDIFLAVYIGDDDVIAEVVADFDQSLCHFYDVLDHIATMDAST